MSKEAYLYLAEFCLPGGAILADCEGYLLS